MAAVKDTNRQAALLVKENEHKADKIKSQPWVKDEVATTLSVASQTH